MRYGTVPVVHGVGGLEDTVVDVRENPDMGFGYKFRDYTPAALVAAIDSALIDFQNRPRWQTIMTRATAQDFSWDRSSAAYLKLYGEAIAG
jgi:starch synthase